MYTLNYYKHELMETLNSVRASHLSFTRSTINRLSQDCVRLTDTFVEQLMWELLVIVASNAIVMYFYFSVVLQWLSVIPTTLPEQSKAVHLLHGRSKNVSV